jgi:2-polyprenyl-3-methyl-5-hydroxy-6-metoxy-1,4-benzoquinol methylase
MRALVSDDLPWSRMPYRVSFADDPDDPLQRELNALYDYADDRETRVLHRARLNVFHGLLADLVARGVIARRETALDVGCNAGFYSKLISEAGFRRVDGLDIEPALIARARATFATESPGRTIAFRVENAEEMDPAQRYDFILCTEVIEHTGRPERVIANLRAALAPGGVLVVTMPNACSLPFGKAALKYRLVKKARDPVFEDHLKWPSWRARRLFEGEDMERVRETGTNLIWDATTLRWLSRSAAFPALNRAQFAIARHRPFCYFAQFFFMVWRKRG